MKKYVSCILVLLFMFSINLFAGCGKKEEEQQDGYKSISGLNLSQNVTLRIAIEKDVDLGLNKVANEFMKKYKNVIVDIDIVENYNTNSNQMMENNTVDIVFKGGLEYEANRDNYYYNFANDTEINFSLVNRDIFNNYKYINNNKNYQYSVPLGGDLRGLFVNKSFLSSLNLSVPTNYTEFLQCCSAIKAAGYVPIHGNPGYACVNFGIADAVNNIVKNNVSYDKLKNNTASDISELFRDTYTKMYELATKRYYDYKAVEDAPGGFFKTVSSEATAEGFLSITKDANAVVTKPVNNIGNVAFLAYTSALEPYISSAIEENNMDTEFEYIATPLNDVNENSSFYITPSLGLSANKNSANLIWAREFVNFIFYPTYNKLYAENSGIISNTNDAIQTLAKKYHTTESSCILSGQINFTDTDKPYNAYRPINTSITNVFKCSASKYMVNLVKDSNDEIIYCNDNDSQGDYLRLADPSKISRYYTSDLSTLENDTDGAYYTLISAPTTKIYVKNFNKNLDGVITYNDGQGDYYVIDKNTKILRNYISVEDTLKPGYAFCTIDYYLLKTQEAFASYR